VRVMGAGVAGILALLGSAGCLLADYQAALVSQGQTAATVRVGEGFDLDLVLTSDAVDKHSAAGLRLVFSVSGLSYERYAWALPYVTGGPDDASTPALASLPARLRPDSVVIAGAAVDQVDVYLSNLLPGPDVFVFGRLLQVHLAVPPDYAGPESIEIRAEVEALADGFKTIPTHVGSPFTLHVAPVAGPIIPALSVALDGAFTVLSWPRTIQGASLETTGDVGDPSSWVAVAGVPSLDSAQGIYTMSLPVSTADRPAFFRLKFK